MEQLKQILRAKYPQESSELDYLERAQRHLGWVTEDDVMGRLQEVVTKKAALEWADMFEYLRGEVEKDAKVVIEEGLEEDAVSTRAYLLNSVSRLICLVMVMRITMMMMVGRGI